jgi:transposase-like protein
MGCCGGSRGTPRYVGVKCPKCGAVRVTVQGQGLSVAWYTCTRCGYTWMPGW